MSSPSLKYNLVPFFVPNFLSDSLLFINWKHTVHLYLHSGRAPLNASIRIETYSNRFLLSGARFAQINLHQIRRESAWRIIYLAGRRTHTHTDSVLFLIKLLYTTASAQHHFTPLLFLTRVMQKNIRNECKTEPKMKILTKSKKYSQFRIYNWKFTRKATRAKNQFNL